MALTGKIDFRKSWFGRLVLLVEEDVKPLFGRAPKRRWRSATPMDLAQPEMRILIDLRSRPQIAVSSSGLSLSPAASRAASPARSPEERIAPNEAPRSRLAH